MILALICCVFCGEYIEITPSNIDLIGGSKAIVVKYYKTTCGHCRAMAEDFAETATTFTDVLFGGVDCGENKPLCKGVDGYPTVMLYKAGEKTGVEHSGSRSVDGFCDFVENYTDFRAKRPPKVTVDLNPLNFEDRVNAEKCTLVAFYAPWCGHSKRFLPVSKVVANSFIGESNLSVALVNCDEYRDMCQEHDISGFPTIKLFTGDASKGTLFEGKRVAPDVIDFMNAKCGTEREVGGLLNRVAGIVPEAGPLVAQFLAGGEDGESAVQKMKEIKGAEFYVTTMERFKAKGLEQLEKDMEAMATIMQARKSSWAAIDGMKKRYNVFSLFVPPKPEAETAEKSTNEKEL